MYEGRHLASLRSDVIQDKRSFAVNKDNFELAQKLLIDPNYTYVVYDPKSGGVLASERGEIVDSPKTPYGRKLEQRCEEQLFKDGHTVIVLREQEKDKEDNPLASLDMILDGEIMDVASITKESKNYGTQIKAKSIQLNKYLERNDADKKAHSLCLYFDNPKLFDKNKVFAGVNFVSRNLGKEGFPNESKITNIICVVRGEKEIKRYEVKIIKPTQDV